MLTIYSLLKHAEIVQEPELVRMSGQVITDLADRRFSRQEVLADNQKIEHQL